MSARRSGRNPKFKRGDIVFITQRSARFGAATFTVAHREYDARIYTWFYRDENGPLYAEGLLKLAAPAKDREELTCQE